ncbi:MAG: hypothetical protein D4R38_01975 [Dehalococcoidia bacterium]|nr:MAG: hypothetical protein D4R38_01975 [Dehalococcoidia bacterium]
MNELNQPGSRQPGNQASEQLTHGGRPGDIFMRRRLKLPRRLHRVLGTGGLFSTAYGNVGSSIYYALVCTGRRIHVGPGTYAARSDAFRHLQSSLPL